MKLSIAGEAIRDKTPAVPPKPVPLGDFMKITERGSWQANAGFRGAGAAQTSLDEAKDNDIVELEYENGVKQWVSVAQLADDVKLHAGGGTRGQAAAAEDEIEIPLTPLFATSAATRGGIGWVLKGLKIFKIDPIEVAAEFAADKTVDAVVAQFESKVRPEPGLYQLTDPNTAGKKIESAKDLDARQPALLFIHGTASSLAGCFGDLAGTAEWEKLRAFYGERIYGWQHKTLTVSPLTNALDLARLLPRGLRLHLVTHSRGGIVGECLNLSSLLPGDTEILGAEGHADDLTNLRALSDLLGEKKLVIERFVRVASPARGTPLAGQRLDLYLSVFVNALGLVPGFAENPIYEFAKATLFAVAQQRTAPDKLPGIEAMMPDSPLIRLLNTTGRSTSADLAVIAGDIEGGSLLGKLGVLATDLFFLEKHDLVVNTASMSAGFPREKGAWQFLDQGPEVNHFRYFFNPRTRERLADWLLRASDTLPANGFQPIPELRASQQLMPLAARRSGEDRPTIILLPGIMGSHLKIGNRRVWLDFGRIVLGGFGELDFAKKAVIETDGVVAMSYARITEYLGQSYDVVPFAYDWRKSIKEAALGLAEIVKELHQKSKQPVRLLAHSMGGLVARALAVVAPEVWQECAQRGGRIVQLGTPNGGSYVIPRLLFGLDRTLQLLALADFKHDVRQLSAWVAGFPGVLDLLPDEKFSDPGARPAGERGQFFDPKWWAAQPGAAQPDAANLARAWDFRAKLRGEVVARDRLVYVAGHSGGTPVQPEAAHGGLSWPQSPEGDGTVPWELGRLPEVRTYYLEAAHGDLANQPQAFEAIAELLEKGETHRLPTEAPRRRAGLELTTLRDDVPLLFPTAHELACAALGASPEAASEVRGPAGTLHIAVTHGDLREAKFPVIVGHYAGDSIVSAEGALDRQLGGRLQRRLDVGLYAGEENTAEVFLDPQAKPPGAIVVGFGEIGSMSAESVRRAVCRGTLSYAVKLLEPHRDGDGQPKRCEGVSAVLLGTNGGRALAPIEAVSAIVNGVVDANAQLVARGLHTRVFIDRLEIIELYEDAALEAQRSLIWFVNSAPAALRRTIALCAEPRLRTGSAGSSHRPYNHYQTGWWRRMLISDTSAGDADIVSLKFEILTDRARVEEKMKIGQRALIDDFLAAARRSSAYAPETAATLFELLIPRELKPRMQLDASLLLVLDDESARYPWEMLAQRVSSGIEPLAERLGILRQFKVAKTRPSERGPRGFSALVIGNPTTHLPPLPGAHAEAVEVAKLLNAGRLDLGDGPLLEASATEIITRFFARDYRVVHIAAHGEVRAASRPADSAETSGARNGVVIGDHRWLTAAEVEALPVTPDLVFLNCCHLGKMSADPQAPAPDLNLPKPGLFAASIAKELIAAGVRVVVVAAWAVDDLAAREFAKCFYEHLLAHEPLGRAVLAARKKVRQLYPQTNTWAAYQVYGDPEFRLETPNESAQQAGGSYRSPYEEYYGRSEVLAELRALAAQARWNGSAADSTGIEKTLAKIATKLPEDWRDGEVLEVLGDAWGAYNFLPKAIHAYREALRHVKGEAALRTLPAIIDAEIRLLEQLAAGAAPREIKQLQHDIKTDVDLLAQFGETAERLSAVGALWKRLALLAKTPEDRKRALLAASKHYGDAHQLARQQQRVDPYPGLNWFLYRWLLGEKHLAKTDPDFAAIKAEVADRLRRSTDFWDIVSGADLLIITHLYAGDLPACEKKIREAFRRALLFGASPKDRAILASHLEFIAKMLPKELAALAATLRILAEFIRSADVQ